MLGSTRYMPSCWRRRPPAEAGTRAGMTGREADALARQVITDAGYGGNFGHGTGHGVGLEIHEGPTLSPRGANVLAAGAVASVEPGIYLPGWGGVRIEDLVVIGADSVDVLTPGSQVTGAFSTARTPTVDY